MYIRDDDPAPWPETHITTHLLAITLFYCATVYVNCSFFIPSTLASQLVDFLQSAAPRPTSRGGLLFHGTHWLPDLRGNRGAEAALTR